MRHRLVCCVCITWMAVLSGYRAVAVAQRLVPVFTPPGQRLSIHPNAQGGALYGIDRRVARWHIGQWNNPRGDAADLGTGHAGNGSLDVRTNAARQATITIAQQGASLACRDDRGPVEFDGLIGTNTRTNDPSAPSAERAAPASISLAALAGLYQSVGLKISRAEVSSVAQPCPVSKAVSLVCVVFHNVRNGTTFFFQVILFAFNTDPHSIWWARGRHGRFGYNALATDVGAIEAQAGTATSYQVDLLPAVRMAIERSPEGMDKRVADWMISAAYFGNALYGSVDLTSQWHGYELIARFE